MLLCKATTKTLMKKLIFLLLFLTVVERIFSAIEDKAGERG